jgi:lactate permease
MLYTLLALLPFALIVYFLVFKEYKASRVLLAAFLLTFLLLAVVWRQPVWELVAASVKGLFVTFELFLIIVGVLLIFFLLEHTKHLKRLEDFLLHLSSDVAVHVIFIGFFLVVFLEAIAGFGTPALIAAPLLVLVGVRPLHAVILTLISDSVVSLFGAFGTPVIIGLEAIPVSLYEVSV